MASEFLDASGKFLDFYQIFSLDQGNSAKECKTELRRIQANIRQAMSDGSLNGEEILKRLQEQCDQVTLAMKCFRNDDTKESYDKQLANAYKHNKVSVEAAKLSQELFEEIATYFAKRQYKEVIEKCVSAINNNVRDVRLYEYMAKSYRYIGDTQHALESADSGLKIDPDSLALMKVESRIYTSDYEDYDAAQKIINRMSEINKSVGTAEQVNLYLNFDKDEMAYQTIDEYVSANPKDEAFKQSCAYDIIGAAYGCYEECEAEDGQDILLILSEESYLKCLEYCNKAVSVYDDENTRKELEDAKHFGKKEFNYANKRDIIWCAIGAAVFLICGFSALGQLGFVEALPILLFCLLPVAATIALIKESYRPYWKIYRYLYTGKRDTREKIVLGFGWLFSAYIRVGFKISWWIFKFAFRLAF